MARNRGLSRSLADDCLGDANAPALSTLTPQPVALSPPLSPHPSSTSVARVSKRRKARSFLRRWKNFSFTHTWVNPLILIVIILSLYAIRPGPSNPLHAAIFLSYPLPPTSPLIPSYVHDTVNAPTYYGKGMADVVFVAFYVIVLSFAREFLMQRLIRPLALRAGIRSRAKVTRFMEQSYTALYFSVSGPLGLYIMYRTPVWYFNTSAMYETYPHYSHDALFKAYYLLQASYWSQQALVLCLLLEKPRKDFRELVGHHIVTLALIACSYRFHFTYMGIAVYITHDVSDFFLATAKVLNYLDASITTPFFTFFVFVWLYLRHYLNLRILFSVLTEFRDLGPFDLNWETQQYKCWIAQYITFTLLAALQAMNLFWLFFILRIAYNAISKAPLRDVRSDAEDDDVTADSNKGNATGADVSSKTHIHKANGHAFSHANGHVHQDKPRDISCQNGTVPKPATERNGAVHATGRDVGSGTHGSAMPAPRANGTPLASDVSYAEAAQHGDTAD